MPKIIFIFIFGLTGCAPANHTARRVNEYLKKYPIAQKLQTIPSSANCFVQTSIKVIGIKPDAEQEARYIIEKDLQGSTEAGYIELVGYLNKFRKPADAINIITRSKINDILMEHKLSLTGAAGVGNAILGGVLGATHFIDQECTVLIDEKVTPLCKRRLIEIGSGKILAAESE